MRAYFKNDLYFGGIEQPKKQTLPVETKPKKVIKTAIAAPKQNIVVDDQLTIKLEKLQDQPLEEALDIHQMLKSFSKKKQKPPLQEKEEENQGKEEKEKDKEEFKKKQQYKDKVKDEKEKEKGKEKEKEREKEKEKAKSFNLNIFKNDHRKKAQLEVKEQSTKQTKNDIQQRKKITEAHKEYKKLQYDLKREAFKMNQDFSRKKEEQTKKEQEGEKNARQSGKTSDSKQNAIEGASEIKNKSNQPGQEQPQGNRQDSQDQQSLKQEVEEKYKSKSKNKKIKKEKNYVRLDLKRKYKDRFIGAINAHLKRYNKNGRLKPQFRKVNNEVTIQDGQLYNSYISSLSKALCMEISLDDSGDNASESQQIAQSQIPQSFSYESLQQYLQTAFGFEDFREGQFETISHILSGDSVVFISETASGKSLTYIMSSMILGGLSLVVSPLVSLILDQLAHLPPYLPAACISSLINREQRDRIISLVKNGEIKLLFITPQSLQTDFLYHLQDFPLVNFVCVDEAHSLSELSHNFRTSFLGLGEILTKHVKYKLGHPTILALTATANPETVISIKQRLTIENEIRSKSCMNKNLYVTVSRERGSQKYDALINYLRQPQIMKCRGILIYARTRKIMFEIFNYVTNSTSLKTAIYHSALSNRQKTETLTKFRQGDIKVVVATIALGMGLDFSHLECVIHINMPKSIENYVQEIGRAGRRLRRAYCHLFLDDNDYITERNYIIADQLQPLHLTSLYDKLKEHSRKQQRGQNMVDKEEKADIAIKRAAIIIEHRGNQDVIQEEEEQEDEDQEEPTIKSTDCLRSLLYYIRIDKLTAATQLREEALLTLLLKIQSIMKAWDVRLRVLPTSYELLKVSFFKNNQDQLKKDSDFFRHLVSNCRKAKGTIYIPLIEKCNKLKLSPIELLTNLYRLGNTYVLKVELDHPVYLWQFQGKRRFNDQDPIEQLIYRSFERLSSEEEVLSVLQQINKVQTTSLIKLNTLYTVSFLHSRNDMNNIVSKKLLIPREEPIPTGSISAKFDEYFRSGLLDYYNKITNNQEEIYIPTSCIEQKDKQEIYDCITVFFRNQINMDQIYNQFQRAQIRRNVFLKFQDGKVITKILMGVNSGEVTWKIYGERPYWMLFKQKNYGELLEAVRQQLARFKNQYSIRSEE